MIRDRAKVLADVARRDGSGCFYCGLVPAHQQLDHVTPKSRGGSDAADNLVLACPPCNYEKGTHAGWLYVLLRERGTVPRRLPVRLPPMPAPFGPGWSDPLHAWAMEQIAARKAAA